MTAEPTIHPETTIPFARGIEKTGIAEMGVLSIQKNKAEQSGISLATRTYKQ